MRVSLQNTPVLVLNASYEGIHVCSARRAFTSVMKGIAVVEDSYAFTIRTGRMTLPVPSVIRLLQYRRIPRRTRGLSRKVILARDHQTCQYCRQPVGSAKLTLDHIIPRSRGGVNSWENLVAACFECNNVKGDRTPEEAGMVLLRRPKPFSMHTSRNLLRESAVAEVAWQKYLFYESAGANAHST